MRWRENIEKSVRLVFLATPFVVTPENSGKTDDVALGKWILVYL